MTGTKFVPRVWMGLLVVAAVTALLIVGALRDAPAQEAVDNSRNAATKPVEYAPPHKMTPDLAVTFVQSEFPGQFFDGDNLIDLFRANCHLLEIGYPYSETVQGMVDNGFSAQEAGYVMNMSIFSTCPDRG